MIRMVTIAAAGLLAVMPRAAYAQGTPHLGSMEAGGGVVWSGGYPLGTASALETRNPGNSTDPTLALFTTDTRVPAVTGGYFTVSFYLARRISVEGGVQFTKPLVTTRSTGDFEGAPDTTSTDQMTQYLTDVSVVFHLAELGGGHLVPYIEGGGGHLRQAHEGNSLIETGNEFHAGGGLRYWFGTSAHRVGLRLDARYSGQSGGFSFNQSRRNLPTVSGGLAYLFR